MAAALRGEHDVAAVLAAHRTGVGVIVTSTVALALAGTVTLGALNATLATEVGGTHGVNVFGPVDSA